MRHGQWLMVDGPGFVRLRELLRRDRGLHGGRVNRRDAAFNVGRIRLGQPTLHRGRTRLAAYEESLRRATESKKVKLQNEPEF